MEKLTPKSNLKLKRSRLFVPDYRVKTIFEIDFRILKKAGVCAIAFDVDSTLTEHGAYKFDKKTLEFLDKTKNTEFIEQVALASNRKKNGLAKIAKEHKFKLVHATVTSRKPSASYYRRIAKTLGFNSRQIAMVGDKLLQDTYGANRAGMLSILVEPLGEEAWYDAFLKRRHRQKGKLERISRLDK